MRRIWQLLLLAPLSVSGLIGPGSSAARGDFFYDGIYGPGAEQFNDNGPGGYMDYGPDADNLNPYTTGPYRRAYYYYPPCPQYCPNYPSYRPAPLPPPPPPAPRPPCPPYGYPSSYGPGYYYVPFNY